MERSFRVIAVFLFAASLFSCNFSKVEDFQLGKDFVNSTSGVVMIDTMKMVTSTIHLDSIVTSKPARLLVGAYTNNFTGQATCTPYLQISSGSSISSLPTGLVYDSLVVKYNYDGYYIGDTTKLVAFSVKKITHKQGYNSNGSLYNISPFKTDADGSLYNTTSFKLDDRSLGDIKVYPHPKMKKDFFFRLSDDYGMTFFNNIINKNDSMQNSSEFQVFLPGIALVSAVDQNQMAFGISQKSISLRVYYHEKVKPVDQVNATFFNFPVDASGLWFNQILYNSQGSYLGSISQNNNPLLSSTELQSSSTYNQTMVQGGTGVYTKIRIPGAQFLKGYAKKVVLISAQIQLTPTINSYSITNQLPDTLAVYVIDRRNVISSQYSSSLGSNIFARKVVPAAFDQLPYYLLDVTQFFTTELGTSTTSGNSLMLGVLGTKTGQSLNSFSFSGNLLNSSMFKMSVYCYIDKSN